jgi:hypothetical protein
MRLGRVLQQHRKLAGVGLVGLLGLCAGCDSGTGEAPPPVIPPGTVPPGVALEQEIKKERATGKVMPKEFTGVPKVRLGQPKKTTNKAN